MTTSNPAPIKANKGPGQAPVMAHPKPNSRPPKIWPFWNGTVLGTIDSPAHVRIRNFLMPHMDNIPVTTADPMTPYIWKLSSRNISCIRHQETTSDFTRITPNKTPERKYFIISYY